MDDASSSSSSSNSISTSASKHLQQRLSGLRRSQWSTETDVALLVHLGIAHSSPHLDILSDCVPRMAEHVRELNGRERGALYTFMTEAQGYRILCRVLGSALQQLAEGVQQYLQQGQLPAALTVHVLSTCCDLCDMLSEVLDWALAIATQLKQVNERADQALRQLFYTAESEEGAQHLQSSFVAADTKPVKRV
jgi:hypothetical protein